GKATIRDIPRHLREEAPVAPAPAYEPAPAYTPAPAPQPAPEPQAAPVAEDRKPSREPEKVDVTFRLVPISNPDDPVIYLRVGDLVTIEGKRYRIIQ
ncbi:MAG: hypothetical protein IKZ91_03925, partial [Bacteroidales bacterium]|nr:hypothetical protein [Bacteroidales bacterium]